MPMKTTQTKGVEISLPMGWMSVVVGDGKKLDTLSVPVAGNVKSNHVPADVLDVGGGRLQVMIGVQLAGQ